MGRSPGLALYLAARSLAARRPRTDDVPALPPQTRPEGLLVWLHVGPGTRPDAITELARRLVRRRKATSVLLTFWDSEGPATSGRLLRAAAPVDAPSEMARFLAHWSPDAIILSGSGLLTSAIVAAGDQNIPVILVDAHIAQGTARALRWAPMATASLFERVAHILAGSETDAAAFRRLRAPEDRVEAPGYLEEGTAPIPCNESDRTELAGLLAARPVWLAAPVEAAEVDAVVSAHARAGRNAHRLLLILVPAVPEHARDLRERLEEAGWQVSVRSDGEEPEPTVQIFIADTPDEMGLWYRLAPITFLGRSLIPGGPGHDPFEPAALGSAILTGPNTNAHKQAFQRFLRAGAARTAGSAEALGDAVADLLAPDRAAEMARRAWEITSAGAEVTDRVIDVIGRVLDRRGAG